MSALSDFWQTVIGAAIGLLIGGAPAIVAFVLHARQRKRQRERWADDGGRA